VLGPAGDVGKEPDICVDRGSET